MIKYYRKIGSVCVHVRLPFYICDMIYNNDNGYEKIKN